MKGIDLAGNNKILKPGTVLFKEGDSSNGMYVIRKGEVLIYLDKDGHEIPLVTVSEGAMVGEMALFDKKPRSASARAVGSVEVTVISNNDFSKILKQIPKWFVSLMTTLSSRLRATNIKLEDLETEYKKLLNPLEDLTRVLHVLNLLWYKHGEREVKTWSMEQEVAEKEISTILGLPLDVVSQKTEMFITSGLLGQGKNSYKKPILTIQNRGSIERFIQFITFIRERCPDLKSLPQEFLDLVLIMDNMATKSAYEAVSITADELMNQGERIGLRPKKWPEYFEAFRGLDDAIAVRGKGGAMSFKIVKKKISRVTSNAKLLFEMSNSKNKDKKVA
ncbi:MAG: Crp/Fnr family transcriptional regulator [Pseudobacteriovorax sp.]|nr:Crp/Fnr family transcriptional regulator [Pseudobacteriovorax sp.]